MIFPQIITLPFSVDTFDNRCKLNLIVYHYHLQESILLESMFEIPGSDVLSVHISEDCVMGSEAAEFIRGTPTSAPNSSQQTSEETWAGVRAQN